jgi:hypothetical protein
MLNPSLHERLNGLAARFQQRDPFRYVVIDDFFSAEYCSALLEQFPAFGSGNARNEAGELGNKSTVKKIRGIGPAYAALDDALRTREFLDLTATVKPSTRTSTSTSIQSSAGTAA